MRVLATIKASNTIPQVASTASTATFSSTTSSLQVSIVNNRSVSSSITSEVAFINTHRTTPIIGSRLESICSINNIPTPILFDTGSPTSLISNALVLKHNWTTFLVKPLQWKGAIPGTTSTATHAVHCSLITAGLAKTIKFTAYVSEDLTDKLIVGNPILANNPTLLNINQANTTTPTVEAVIPTVTAIDILKDNDGSIIDLYADEIEEVFTLTLASLQESNSFHLLPTPLLTDFNDMVSDTLPPHGGEISCNHDLQLKEGGKPPRLPPYRMTPKLEKECKLIIKDLLHKGFITDGKSPVSSPVLLVKKKDGTYRMVVDFRELNKITIKDPYPLPRIDDLMAKVGDCSIFSTLDLHSGCHQISLADDAQQLTGFTTPFGHYEYKVMSFELCNAPATFSRFMNRLLSDLTNVCVYLDDILIASKDRESHIEHLRGGSAIGNNLYTNTYIN